MRLLERDDTGGVRLTENLPNNKIPPYAILSHTWGPEEVLFKDMTDGIGKNKAGYDKIRFCGDQAWRDGLKFFWVDTCCIDKSDSAELQHALNSMFHWYRSAVKCYVYLADVSTHQHSDGPSWQPAFRESRWFSRGWTLQELIAPTIVEFFSKEGERLGDKKSLEQEIHEITGIPQKAFQGVPLSDFSVAERMRWIEKRDTQYEEDKVYSLFGIFDVHIPVLYGEGRQKALKRLQDKVHEDYLCLAKLWSTEPRDPHVEKERIELAKGGLLADAYRWVFDNPDFNRWHQLQENRLLWVKGDPGKGKTMLLCGIIDELERRVIADGGNLAYFFCQATDSRINNATAVLRGLIYLLAHWQPRLLSHLPENTYPSDDAMAWIVLSKVLCEMLKDPNLKITYLVIDALDECVIDQPQLLKLIVQISSVSARVKWLVSSRNSVQIEEQLAMVAQQSRLSLEQNAESVTTAVNAYIRHKVFHLSRQKQYDSTMQTVVHDYLSSNANGNFLWVALVCQVLADPSVRRWQTLTKLRAFPPGLDSLYARMKQDITLSRDSDLLESNWNACLQTLEGHSDLVGSAAFSSDGQRLASGSGDRTIKIWDAASGSCLQTLEGHSDLVGSVAFSPDGQRLASGSGDRTIKIWDAASGSCLQTLEGHSDLVGSVAFSPDGQRLASGSGDRTIKIWDIASGSCLQTLEGHSNLISSVAFSPDGQRLASGSGDRTIKIWDIASGSCLQTLEGHSDLVSSVAFSPDGQQLAFGSGDKAIKIWNLDLFYKD